MKTLYKDKPVSQIKRVQKQLKDIGKRNAKIKPHIDIADPLIFTEYEEWKA